MQPEAVCIVFSVASCGFLCQGSKYFEVKDGYICVCGNTLVANSAAGPNGECDVPCLGNLDEACGEEDRGPSVFDGLAKQL